MYTDKKNILQLVALLEAHGITKVVLCPGSRNAPIVHTLSNHPGFTCYAMTDERSAGYFAIGLTLNGGKPAECSFGCHFCGSSRCLDRADGRTDFAAA